MAFQGTTVLASLRFRGAAVVGAVAAVLVLAAVDVEHRVVDGDLAVAVSLPHAFASAFGRVPLPLVERRAIVERDLRRGDATAAAALIPPDDADVDVDLRGRVAESRGDILAATAAYARVGDATRAKATIDSLAARGELAGAMRAQTALAQHYERAGGLVPEAAADAWWRLGVLRSFAAWATHGAARTQLRVEALDAYRRALTLAPNEETYLLSVGEGELEAGDPVAAIAAYERALEVGPASADASLGLLRAEAVAGRCATAHDEVDRARRTAAGAGRHWPDVLRQPATPWDAAVRRCGL